MHEETEMKQVRAGISLADTQNGPLCVCCGTLLNTIRCDADAVTPFLLRSIFVLCSNLLLRSDRLGPGTDNSVLAVFKLSTLRNGVSRDNSVPSM